MIQHGYELDFSKQTFGVILYGAPGIGKTTLALSDHLDRILGFRAEERGALYVGSYEMP